MAYLKENLKTKGIVKISPDDSLSKALASLKSSHDAAFVFNDHGEFMGVINPYYAMIHSTAYDGNTKVHKALFHPPSLNLTNEIDRVAKMMIESKIHYLPVFNDKNEFEGIISARRLLTYISKLKISQNSISSMKHTQKGLVITIDLNDTISKAVNLFKEFKTSKIVVVDKNGKLKGVLSHYDLIPNLIAPAQRYESRGDGNKSHFKDMPIKNFVKPAVLKMTNQDLIKDAITGMLNREIGSVILTDKDDKPTGIITTKDLLGILVNANHKKSIIVSNKSLEKIHKPVFDDFYDYLNKFVNSEIELNGAEFHYQKEKDGHLHKVQLHLIPVKGKMHMFSREGHDFSRLLQELKEIIRDKKFKK